MCGIAGQVAAHPTHSRNKEVLSMLDLIRHRGPDGTGIIDSPFGSIGHVRLSILDNSTAAAQPFFSEDFVLSYNGEIYNYKEIQSDLPDRHYNSHSDTEVLFHSVSVVGLEETLRKARGMFAFCWHNTKTGETFLVRDRFGIKPLFYTLNSRQELVFASELKALLFQNQTPINSFRAAYAFLGGLERDGHTTAWDHIHQIPPGHYLHFKDGQTNLVNYFKPLDFVDEAEYRTYDRMSRSDLVSKLDDILKQAVNDMGMGDIPAGSFISGGVDSGLISYYGKQHNPNIKLFSSDVDGPYSEAHLARVNAKAIGSELFMTTYRDNQCLVDLVNCTWHYESPLVVHFNAIPLSGLSKLTRHLQTKAVLTGEGADELFVGYPHLVGGSVDSVLSLPYEILDRLYAAVPGLRRFREKKVFGSNILTSLRHTAEGKNASWSFHSSGAGYSFLPASERKKHMQTTEMLNSHLLSLLWRNDRMGMMYSIESRFPFLDERVVRFALNLPYRHKVSIVNHFSSWKHPFHSGKHLVRLVANKYLPGNVAFGQKKGFPVQGINMLQVNHAYFADGFMANILQLNKPGMNRFLSNLDSYHTALFSLVEIWGKLFVDKQDLDDVKSAVLKNFSLNPS